MSSASTWGRFAEAVACATAGGAVAVGFTSLVARVLDAGPWLVPVGAALAAANGAVSGLRRIYSWGCADGPIAFVLDSSWALPMTAPALFAHAVSAVQRDPGYDSALSERRNHHVYRRGFVPRRGFAITLGNVIGGAGDTSLARRRRLVTDHEAVHCWQARWFGPLYPVLYVGWMIVGGAVGAVWWLAGARRRGRFVAVVETVAYYLNPFEWWAYSRHGYWPPSGKVDGIGWRRPCCRPLAELDRPSDPVGPVSR